MSRTLDDLGLKPNERAALEELGRRLCERFGDRLVKLVVFGTRAIAVIRDFDRAAERDTIGSLRTDIDIKHGVFLQLLTYSRKDYDDSLGQQWPLFVDAESEGVALHGSVSGRREPTTPANRRLQARMLMERAKQSLRSAESMFSLPDLQAATSCEACLAVLRAAESLLAAKGRRPTPTLEIVPAFGEEFVKTGDLDARFGRMLDEARRRRTACTYDITHEETKEAAGSALGSARAFLAAAEKRLKAETKRPG